MTDWREREFRAAEEISTAPQMNAKDEGQQWWRIDRRGRLEVLYEGRWEGSGMQWAYPDQYHNRPFRGLVEKACCDINTLQQQVTELEGKARHYREGLLDVIDAFNEEQAKDAARAALTSPSTIAQEEQQ